MGTARDKAVRWASLRAARRVAKSVPFVGAAVVVYLLRDSIKRKGWVGGLAHTALDAIPYLGALKNGIELFTDDLIPDRRPAAGSAPPAAARQVAAAPTGRTPSSR